MKRHDSPDETVVDQSGESQVIRGVTLRVKVFGLALLEHQILDRPPAAWPPTCAGVDHALPTRSEAREFPPRLAPPLA